MAIAKRDVHAGGMIRLLLSTLFFVIAGVARSGAADIQVAAAASLTDALKEVGAAYQAATGDRPVFNLGASSTLARQIEEGAPVDVFLSADEAKMEGLAKKNLIATNTRRVLLSNSLVVVVLTDSPLKIDAPAALSSDAVRRLALGETNTVPAGIYAREFLTRVGLWEKVQARVLPCDNVRAALAAVESGNAEAGIVYKTDAGISKKVRVAYEVPAAQSPVISYPGAVIAGSKQAGAARKFLDYLAKDEAKRMFEKFGFRPAP
jgi:molybdate transport system substrate-binding protein